MVKRVVILSSQEGDWEGFFLDGKLIDEGHKLGEGRSSTYLMEQGEKYGFRSVDIIHSEVNNIDEEMLSRRGSFFQTLDELNGVYNNDRLD